MSLFTDLREVFTAYANRIKGLAAADEQIKADLDAIEPGLSYEAKEALLACFDKVAWLDEDGREDYYNALASALNFSPYWDLDWNAKNGALPIADLVCVDYSFANDALEIVTPNIDLHHIGNMRIRITCKMESYNPVNGNIAYQNNPQIVFIHSDSNGDAKGMKLICASNLNRSPNKNIAMGVNATNALVAGYAYDQFNTYDITMDNGTYTLKINENDISITPNDTTSRYYKRTGIASSFGMSSVQKIYIKELQVKWLGESTSDFPKITAAYVAGSFMPDSGDSLSVLLPYLTVRYYSNKYDRGTVITADDFTLSGSLSAAESVVTITYDSYSTSINVPVNVS